MHFHWSYNNFWTPHELTQHTTSPRTVREERLRLHTGNTKTRQSSRQHRGRIHSESQVINKTSSPSLTWSSRISSQHNAFNSVYFPLCRQSSPTPPNQSTLSTSTTSQNVFRCRIFLNSNHVSTLFQDITFDVRDKLVSLRYLNYNLRASSANNG